MPFFPDFAAKRVPVSEGEVQVVTGGEGPPLLLLHGYPQTHVMWHKVAPALARNFTVVASDLRGYGDSLKPETDADHAPYAKRAMARDQVEAMAALGHERFFVAGHDRGGRVAHRMALDHPDRVLKIAVLDIVPTAKMFETVDRVAALAYYHWFFLAQPYDLPERLIGADPVYYLERKIGSWGASQVFDPAALAEYRRCFSDPKTIHGSCEDYRAAATIDLANDAADKGRKIACPLLALWSGRNLTGRHYDVLACWRERAVDVRGRAFDCGHFLPEEKPAETLAELETFFRS